MRFPSWHILWVPYAGCGLQTVGRAPIRDFCKFGSQLAPKVRKFAEREGTGGGPDESGD